MEPVALDALTVVCLAVHLLCVNVSSAAPLLGVMLRWHSRRHPSRVVDQQARWLGIQSLLALLLGGLAGLGLGGLMWLAGDRGLFEVLPRFTYKIGWALGELVFYIACMLGYLALFNARFARRGGLRGLQAFLAVLAATNLLYHFPPLFSVMARAADQPELVSASVRADEFRSLMTTGHVMAMTVHFALASLAVGGVLTMHRLLHVEAPPDESTAVARAARGGAIVALAATALQLLVGVWVLLSLGPLAQSRLTGRDAVGATSLVLSILLTFWLLHQLARASATAIGPKEARWIAWGLMLIILLMCVTLRRAEQGEARVPVRNYGPDGLSSANWVPLSSTTRTTLS